MIPTPVLGAVWWCLLDKTRTHLDQNGIHFANTFLARVSILPVDVSDDWILHRKGAEIVQRVALQKCGTQWLVDTVIV